MASENSAGTLGQSQPDTIVLENKVLKNLSFALLHE